jgi:AraC-like DNA-binding protein
LRDGRSYGVCTGLEVRVGEGASEMPFPRATIRLHPNSERMKTRSSDEDSAVIIGVSPARLRMLLDNAPMADALFDGNVTEFHVDNPVLVRRITQEILQSDSMGDFRAIFLKGKVVELLVELLARPHSRDRSGIAEAARDILRHDPLNPPTMGELARLVGVPQRKLSSDFKRTFGLTVQEWLADWRLSRGRDLLEGGAIPIAEISASLGYAHLSAFTAAFTRKFGVPPTRLRSGLTAI